MGGFTTSLKTKLVRADRIGRNVYITLFDNHPLQKPVSDNIPLMPILESGAKLLRLFQSKEIYVDVPIDLQGLPYVNKPQYVWQAIKRSVDMINDALSPYAHTIGSQVTRFDHLLQIAFNKKKYNRTIIETYPKKSLMNLDLYFNKYKGLSVASCPGWKQEWLVVKQKMSKDKDIKNCSRLVNNLNKLGIIAYGRNLRIDDNVFDAIICALTGIVEYRHRYSSKEIHSIINSRGYLKRVPCNSPQDYAVISKKNLRKSLNGILLGIDNIYFRVEEAGWNNVFVTEDLYSAIKRFR